MVKIAQQGQSENPFEKDICRDCRHCFECFFYDHPIITLIDVMLFEHPEHVVYAPGIDISSLPPLLLVEALQTTAANPLLNADMLECE